MVLFAEHFQLGKGQPELDFVNVPIDSDIALFVDPFSVSQRVDRWSQDCHAAIMDFFQRVVDSIRADRNSVALQLLQFLREPNETRFGFSKGRPQGAGIGNMQARAIFDRLRESSAVRTGFLTSLEECELVVEGIGPDKISDLTTNIIRRNLADYTRDQCHLLGVPTRSVSLGRYYSPDRAGWVSGYLELPVAAGRPVLLVPKAVARWSPAYEHHSYYSDFVLDYLQTEHLHANSSLVQTLRNGTRRVTKRALEAEYPCSKEFLFEFSRQHPNVLETYRVALARMERRGRNVSVDPQDEKALAGALSLALKSIPAGGDNAAQYHSLMVGVVEFLFFPELLQPRKEKEIHQGRKRIDIVMENGATEGPLWTLHAVKKVPCAYVPFECKNYRTDVANPELDQLTSRFSVNRGQFGIMCCRKFEDRATFIERCRDTFKDERGLVIPLDDETVAAWLLHIQEGHRQKLRDGITDLIADVMLA